MRTIRKESARPPTTADIVRATIEVTGVPFAELTRPYRYEVCEAMAACLTGTRHCPWVSIGTLAECLRIDPKSIEVWTMHTEPAE